MLSFLVMVAVLATSAIAEDYNLDIPYPYNCSTRPFCSELRTKLPTNEEVYTAVYKGFNNGSLEFLLNSSAGTNSLYLNIWGVDNKRFRVIIEETDRHRYKLQYALAQDPVVRQLSIVDTTTSGVVKAEDGVEQNQVVVWLSPFSIQFFQDGSLRQTFDGTRLIVQNSATSQAFAFSQIFDKSVQFMGLHEHADWLNLRHTADYNMDPYRLRNTDYGTTRFDVLTTESMYGSVPVLYSFGGANPSSGIFVNNAAEMYIEIDNNKGEAYFMVDGGTLDLFVLLGPTVKHSVRQYMNLTGTPHMPQLWALGYHQCRWAYSTSDDVMMTITGFDNGTYTFPLDVLWLDIEYTAERKWFTWNLTSFPDPVEMLDWVDSQGHRKIVPISDPHMKIDEDYPIYVDGRDNNYFIKDQEGKEDFVSLCWPGNVTWFDYLNPAARDYYAKQHLYENFLSTPTLGGFWNDMNEPTLFDNKPERTTPFSVTHYGGVKHRDVHNIYAMLQTMSTHSGLMARDQGKLRPFILSRAFFAGQQRYALKWSGDNWGQYDNLRISVPMALTANLAGVAFYGADVTGFQSHSSNTTDEELCVRWYQTGIWLPFFRAHANQDVPRREPWRFTDPNKKILHEVLGLRYKHLPYWYTLFYEHVQNGDPLIKPLLFDYPEEKATYQLNDEWLVGSDILVASVFTESARSVSVYFPGGDTQFWYQITGTGNNMYQGSNKASKITVDQSFTPVFYRGGSIIVRKETVRRSSTEMRPDPHTLFIVLDSDQKATGTVYLDDYESFEYENSKNCLYLTLEYSYSSKQLNIKEDTNCKPVGLVFEIEKINILKPNADKKTYTIETKENITFDHRLVKKL